MGIFCVCIVTCVMFCCYGIGSTVYESGSTEDYRYGVLQQTHNNQ